MELYDRDGHRLYLTAEERAAFLDAARKADREVRTFCTVLHDTGCRISEALALTPGRIDFSGKALVFEILKKRRRGLYSAVPVPDALGGTLDIFMASESARGAHRPPNNPLLLWCWSCQTSWRRIQKVMDTIGIEGGPHKCSRACATAQPAQQMDGARKPRSDRYLRQRPRRRAAQHRRQDVGVKRAGFGVRIRARSEPVFSLW